MRFTPAQRAQGILTTFSRGDYSLAVARLMELKGKEREAIHALVVRSLTAEELKVWRRYSNDLVWKELR